MAISRRLRFEILRRDDYTCRYCGASSPEVELTVDHVIPATLGGSDEPENLVTACQPCNAGKSSIQPDAPLVADVSRDALRWKQAMAEASVLLGMERDMLSTDVHRFQETWDKWTYGVDRRRKLETPPDLVTDPLHLAWRRLTEWRFYPLRNSVRPISLIDGTVTVQVEKGSLTEARQKLKTKGFMDLISSSMGQTVMGYEVIEGFDGAIPPTPLPEYETWEERVRFPKEEAWRDTVERFLTSGLPITELERLVDVAMGKSMVRGDQKWRYFCGCAWKSLTTLQESARRIVESGGTSGA